MSRNTASSASSSSTPRTGAPRPAAGSRPKVLPSITRAPTTRPRFSPAATSSRFDDYMSSGDGDVPQSMLDAARTSGRLNIANRSLTALPESLWTIYDMDPKKVSVSIGSSDSNWYESVDMTRIAAGDNEIEELDWRITTFETLTYLDLHNNKLRNMPGSLGELAKLVSLNLATNCLVELPHSVFDLAVLSELFLQHNRLRYIDSGIARLAKLRHLDLSHNELDALPAAIGQLKGLTKLNLDGNKLTAFPAGMGGLVHLRELLANENALKTTFVEATTLPLLERLELRKNHLVEFSDHTVTLPALRELLVPLNRLIALGNVVCSAPNLQVLDISQNKLAKIPVGVYLLCQITRLDISMNDIERLPAEIGLLSDTLQSFSYEGNPIKSGIPRASSTAQMLKLLRMRLDDEDASRRQAQQDSNRALGLVEAEDAAAEDVANQLEHLAVETATRSDEHSGGHESILSPQNISTRTLNMIDRGLGDESSMSHARDLGFDPVEVILSKNLFTAMPVLCFDHRASLRVINLSQNKLARFPCDPTHPFPHLRRLDLGQNLIAQFPACSDFAATYPELRELSLARNRITGDMPSQAQPFPKLEQLILRGNKITRISVEYIRQLQVLDVADNDIMQLPIELGACHETMRTLALEGNPFRIPRREVVEKGADAVLLWLKARMR